jgi:hypothetical protein
VQQIRDGLFPGGDVFVADDLLFSRVIAIVARFCVEIGVSRLTARLIDFFGLVLVVEGACRLFGSSALLPLLMLAVAPPRRTGW